MIFIHCSMTHCVMQEGARGLFAAAPRVAFRYRHDTRKNVAVTYISIITEFSQRRKGGVA
jgi:hypothetical protein